MINQIWILLLLFPCVVSAQNKEVWECENSNKGYDQFLTVHWEGGEISSFEYVGMAPSSNDETKYSCSMSATRSGSDSKWKSEGNKTIVNFVDTAGEEDRLIITKIKDTLDFEFEVSPSICGHSTPMAVSISITKNKKKCHKIELNT